MLEVKCFVGKQELNRESLKKITVDDKVINNIVAQVNRRGAQSKQNNG